MATIYDVAQSAKVSPKTVSRVLNGDAPVKEETRRAVRRAIAELGYVPSSAARTMRSNRSGLVGLITGALSQAPQPTELSGLPELFIVQGIQRRIEASGKTLLISDTGGHAERVPGLIRTFMEHRVEGLLYVAAAHQQVALPAPARAARMVLVNCHDDAGTPAILPDDRACQRRLVLELIRRGHRRIAYLTLAPTMEATALRLAGYRDALAQAGLAFDEELVACGDPTNSEDDAEGLLAAIDQIVDTPDPPSVVCCGNDRMAMRVYGVLRARGIEVPGEVSVAGFDNYRLIAETLYPPLTTVELPYLAMGQRGAERLLALIGGAVSPSGSAVELVRGEVFWRRSVIDRTSTTTEMFQKGGRECKSRRS